MRQSVEAVYENGVLRPLTPLQLQDQEQVTLLITSVGFEEEDWLDHECIHEARQLGDDSIRLEDVRQALSVIPGPISQDVRAERDERG